MTLEPSSHSHSPPLPLDRQVKICHIINELDALLEIMNSALLLNCLGLIDISLNMNDGLK